MPKRNCATHENNTRPVVQTFRMSEDEQVMLRTHAARSALSVSDYVRRQALRGDVIVDQPAEIMLPPAIVLELKRIGVNLNQIARVMNSGGDAPPELWRLCSRLEAIVVAHIERSLPHRW